MTGVERQRGQPWSADCLRVRTPRLSTLLSKGPLLWQKNKVFNLTDYLPPLLNRVKYRTFVIFKEQFTQFNNLASNLLHNDYTQQTITKLNPTKYSHRVSKVKAVLKLSSSSWEPISELRNVTCHMGSHSVTCHPTQVN